MKIYLAHSREFDYVNELYNPIRNDELLKEYDIVLPHEKNDISSNTREFYNDIDIFIAEVSYPSTGLGIELGWAFDNNIPIYCIYKKGMKVSGSISAVTDKILEYDSTEKMIDIIREILDEKRRVL